MFEPMSPKTVRLAVSELLDKRKMTTAEFADVAGLTYNQALALRRGVTSRIDLYTMGRIMTGLDIDNPGVLFSVEDSETHQ